MDTFSTLMAVVQLALAMLLARHSIKVKHAVDERRQAGDPACPRWISMSMLAMIGGCAIFIGWRLYSITNDIHPETRIAVGNGVLTTFLVGFYVLVTAIGRLSAHKPR